MSFDKTYLLENKQLFALLLVLLLAVSTIISSSWSLFSLLSQSPNTPNQTQKRVSPQKTHIATNKSHYPLFGEYIPTASENRTIPKTLLNLKLVGVLKASTKVNSQAIIQIVGGEEKVYRLNDNIPGEAKIVRIFDDSILLLRQGQIERLSLSRPKLKSAYLSQPLEFKS